MVPRAEVQEAFDRGEHQQVLRLTDAILDERPGDDAAHELRARSLLALGRTEEAERHAGDAVRLDPDEIRYRELLAQVLSARGAHRDAAGEYARLARNDPRQPAWILAESGERLDASEPSAAVDAARRAVRLDPRDADAQLALARALILSGDGQEALSAATAAVELRPADVEIREALADASWLTGRYGEAFTGFRALAQELTGAGRDRVTAKARALYSRRSGTLGRLWLVVPGLFGVALRRGWVRVA